MDDVVTKKRKSACLDADNTAGLDFLKQYAPGNACLGILYKDGSFENIRNLNLAAFRARCPLFALAFERTANGMKYHIEGCTQAQVTSFLRYIYTGNYIEQEDAQFERCSSLLLHAQMSKMAADYDQGELRSEAYVNIVEECEFSCSLPIAPIDLCDTIRYIYKYLASDQRLIETIVHYCVECFLYHKLGEDATFKQVAYDLREFLRDLSRINIARNFQDEAAMDIIRLPTKTNENRKALDDYLISLWGDDDDGEPQGQPPPIYRPFKLPARPRTRHNMFDSGPKRESDCVVESSDDEGYTVIRRSKRRKPSAELSYDACSEAEIAAGGGHNASDNDASAMKGSFSTATLKNLISELEHDKLREGSRLSGEQRTWTDMGKPVSLCMRSKPVPESKPVLQQQEVTAPGPSDLPQLGPSMRGSFSTANWIRVKAPDTPTSTSTQVPQPITPPNCPSSRQSKQDMRTWKATEILGRPPTHFPDSDNPLSDSEWFMVHAAEESP
ncbi:hypothetical protein LTR66_003262 [Elasticomyces elasticus]|nr:hypothetical protein LTR66_003262 [Elasticomyces elasticus]